MAIGVKGEVIAESEPFVPQVVNVELDLSKLKSFREKFPVWKDADEFVLKKYTKRENANHNKRANKYSSLYNLL